MSVTRVSKWLLAGLLTALIGSADGCKKGDQVVGAADTTRPQLVRPDCPNHAPFIVRLDTDSVTVSELSVAGPITLIPEFHDCQEFIMGDGVTYGPLVGIFASYLLDTLNLEAAQNPRFPAAPPAQRASSPGAGVRATAEIVNFGRVGYDPLGIKPGFNCLYVYSDQNTYSGLSALMVPVGLQETACGQDYDPNRGGTPLLVFANRPPGGFTRDDYPPVARWDWDPESLTQYIGIKCGDAWCEVGPMGGFSPSAIHPFPLPTSKERRPYWIKGWNDEQWLAVTAGSGLAPTQSLGSLIPDSRLGEYTLDSFRERWTPVAKVAIAPHITAYASKFHFTASTLIPGKANQLFMCFATWEICRASEQGAPTAAPLCQSAADGNWWVRIDNTVGEHHYRCVTRREMSGVTIPGTARWRWLSKDETVWVRCSNGCCEVNADE